MAKKSSLAKWKRVKRFKSREYNRCERCGRARGYMGKFKICRVCFRELVHQGVLPGVRKASW